jgi:hypothetical protein
MYNVGKLKIMSLFATDTERKFMSKKNRNHTNPKKDNSSAMVEFSARKLHKDWRAWLVVGFMLAAILMYVLSLDDSVIPGSFRN